MHTKTIRPGLTAAMTAGRALLAAGWRYDATSPMANDTTIRTLLHPSGREIHARTVDGGEQTALTMTGLTLEQVAGAVAGAGLAPTEPQTREIKARYLVAGMTVIDGTDGPLVVTSVSRPCADRVLAHFEGQPEPTLFGLEVGVTVVEITRYMSCPRECGVDVREHNSSSLVDGQCDTDANDTPAADLHQRLAAELHRIADDIVRLKLPLGHYPSLRLGVVGSRTDLEQWTDYLGTTLDVADSTGIPSVTTRIKLSGDSYGPELTIGVQSPKEQSEVARLQARVAELEAQQAGGTR